MMDYKELISSPAEDLIPHADRLRLAAAAYLARFKGASRDHNASDLRCYLTWCAERGLDPLAARRPHLELYIRWMQEIRRFRPPAVSRRLSVASGFYRTCVIDGVLEYSPAEHVRRPSVPAESPTLGFTHLQFDALLTAARQSANRNDFALVAMLGVLGLRIFEATGADISDLGQEHGHRVLQVYGKGARSRDHQSARSSTPPCRAKPDWLTPMQPTPNDVAGCPPPSPTPGQRYRDHEEYQETVEVSIALDAGSRGQGVGRARIGSCSTACTASRRFMSPLLALPPAQRAPVALHRKFGFSEEGTFREYAIKNGKYRRRQT